MEERNHLLQQIEEKKKALDELISEDQKEKREWLAYYEKEVFPYIRQYFQNVESKKVKKEYDVLILTVGSSIYPLILSIDAIRPKNVVFLCTDQYVDNVNRIAEISGLRPTQIKIANVDPVDPEPIYKKIKEISLEYKGKTMAVDFTGGTKSMSGGMAMAGGMVGADLVYISSKWNNLLRIAMPGTERLELLSNPYLVFGDIEVKRVQKLWEQGEYFAASDLLDQLYEKLPEQYEYHVLSELAKAYSSWELFNMKGAYEHMEFVVNTGFPHLRRMGKTVFSEKEKEILKNQLEIIQTFTDKHEGKSIALKDLQDVRFIKNLLFIFYTLALKLKKQNRLDISSLYLYRVIEMIGQHRMATYGVATDQPDYSELRMDEETLMEKLNQLLKRLKIKQRPFKELPEQLALANTHLLLTVLDDPVAQAVHHGKLRNVSEARNYSILAHGFINIDESKYKSLFEVAQTFLEKFLEVNQSRMEEAEHYQFIIPDYLKNA